MNLDRPKSNLHVEFEPIGRRIELLPGTTLLEAAQRAGLELVAACGGVGICGTCLIQLISGAVSEPTPHERLVLGEDALAAGERLACQVLPLERVKVEVPSRSLLLSPRLQLGGREPGVHVDPAVFAIEVDLPAGNASLEGIKTALAAAGNPKVRVTPEIASQLGEANLSHPGKVRLAIRKGRPAKAVAVLPAGALLAGAAVDLGTTKIAVYLVDLETGATLGQSGVMNPQISYGEDVVSRIAYANRGEPQRLELQERILETIQAEIAGLCTQNHLTARQVVDLVVVGNTAMHHLFCGLPVQQLGAAPYVPAVSDPLEVPAHTLGLRLAPGAGVYLPANIAGYVGGDHSAALLVAKHMPSGRGAWVLADIGTNTEISLFDGKQIFSCSCASGPAFEGAHIHDGMRAAAGAIDSVQIRDGGVTFSTVGGSAPIGICGTGILDAVAALLECGLVDARGALRRGDPRVHTADGSTAFQLVPPQASAHGQEIVITRKDVHEIQLAKGAIRAGIEVLLREAGLQAGDIQNWMMAGAFGTYLNPASALRVGMFPPVPHSRFHQMGNAAGAGGRSMLLSLRQRRRAERLARQVRYIELTTYPEFQQIFMDAMFFG